MQYVYDAKGLFKRDGFYYEIVDYENGYHGCVDPAQFFKAPLFTRELGFGMSGPDVKRLQGAIGMPESYQTGYFGILTKGAVILYQWKHSIPPMSGYVGPLTLKKLNGG